MNETVILKSKLDVLQSLTYETISYLDNNKLRQKTYVSFDKILQEIEDLRNGLRDLGYNYFDGNVIEVKDTQYL